MAGAKCELRRRSRKDLFGPSWREQVSQGIGAELGLQIVDRKFPPTQRIGPIDVNVLVVVPPPRCSRLVLARQTLRSRMMLGTPGISFHRLLRLNLSPMKIDRARTPNCFQHIASDQSPFPAAV